MTSSRNLIYALHRNFSGSFLNSLIRDGITFETHVFPFKNALVLVYRFLPGGNGYYSPGNMKWELIKAENDKISSYSSSSIFPETHHSPETVADVVQEKFGLTDGDSVDDSYRQLIWPD